MLLWLRLGGRVLMGGHRGLQHGFQEKNKKKKRKREKKRKRKKSGRK
jgi:hypothetical protein